MHNTLIVALEVGEWHSGGNVIRYIIFKFLDEEQLYAVAVIPELEKIYHLELPSIFLIS